jgi:hypothetical protein
MKMRIMPAVVVTVGCVTIDDTLSPAPLPLAMLTIVPVPSRFVFAAETVPRSFALGLAAYVGEEAMSLDVGCD